MEESIVKEYIASLSEVDLLCLKIARQTLGSLFDIKKSNDFLKWVNRHHHTVSEKQCE